MQQQNVVVIGVLGLVVGVLVTNAGWWIAMLRPKQRLGRVERCAERGIFEQALARAQANGDSNGAELIRREAALRGIRLEGRS
ncbi:MAG: hypothetical protein WAZ94_15135 [Phycisphaerales bacterium]|nr:hypothetical protein [Chloroflexota bacterium]